jgi:small subunit ribosomal protein S7
MPRKGHIPKRDPIADPIYNSTLVTKFVNTMMWGGKKSTAQNIFYKSMENRQSGFAELPAEAWRLHPRLYVDA